MMEAEKEAAKTAEARVSTALNCKEPLETRLNLETLTDRY
jgi:hypothetical protein